MRLRWPIVAAWLVVVVVGFWASGRLSSLQSNVFTVPGTDAEHVRSVLQHRFGDRSDGAFTVVFRVGNGDYGVALAYCTVLIGLMALAVALIQWTVGERTLGRRALAVATP